MALYEFKCECGHSVDRLLSTPKSEIECTKCGGDMRRVYSPPAMIKIDGLGFPSRRKWMDNWTPDSQPMQIGSLHGEKY